MSSDFQHSSLAVGNIVRTDGKLWRVGLVNASRARLDPISGSMVTMSNPVSGRTFQVYGASINISPNSIIEVVERDAASLTDADLQRLLRLEQADRKGNTMTKEANEQTAEERKAANKARLEEAKKKKAGESQKARAEKTKKNAEAKGIKLNPCKCGCGEKTGKSFFPGHDARFKGHLLKIEKGIIKKEDALSKAIIAEYKWKKRGPGEIPTTNYAGEPHSGYMTDVDLKNFVDQQAEKKAVLKKAKENPAKAMPPKSASRAAKAKGLAAAASAEA